MNSNIQIAKKALKVLKSIPHDEFIKDRFTNMKEKKCCSIGHIIRLESKDPTNYSFSNCSDSINYHPIRNLSINGDNIVHINNYSTRMFPQTRIKSRVLAFLRLYIKLNS